MKIINIHSPNNLKLTKKTTGDELKFIIKTNPGLVLHKKETDGWTYYISYRYFVCGNPKKSIKLPKNIGTPWEKQFKCHKQGTGIALIKFKKNNTFKIVEDLINKHEYRMVDTRLFNWDHKLFTCGSLFLDEKDNMPRKVCEKITNNYKKGKWCSLYAMSEVDFKKKCSLFTCSKTYAFKDVKILCPNIHDIHEKNWAPFTKGKDLYFQYAFTPYTIVKYNKSKNTCKTIKTKNSSIFEKMSRKYNRYTKNKNNYFQSTFVFACTTPLIPMDNDLLGVGHIKIFLKDAWIWEKDNPHLKKLPAWKFIQKIRKKYNLPKDYSKWNEDKQGEQIVQPANIVYLWFFYTLDAKTFNLKKFSKFFTPNGVNQFAHMVSFPMGLQPFMDKQYIIPYGVSDIAINAMIISKKEIKSKLKYDNKTDFDKIPFSLN